MTPLIDIVFLLLIFFMLTSRFVVQEGIQVDLPRTESPHAVEETRTHRIAVRSDGTLVMAGMTMTLRELGAYLNTVEPAFMKTPFEILADRSASVQAVVSLLELLRDKGAGSVTIGTETHRSGQDSR